jgi:hypothetical protein
MSRGVAVVDGDLQLQRALDAHIDAWLGVVAETLATRESTVTIAAISYESFQAIGALGPEGSRCFATAVAAAASASASMNVCIQASSALL